MSGSRPTPERDRSVDRAHAVIRSFARSAGSAAGEDPGALVALLRHTLPAHFAVEERRDGFFDRLLARGAPAALIDRLRVDHGEFLERLRRLEDALARGEPVSHEVTVLAERLREHEWLESASAAQVGELSPADLSAEPDPAEATVPATIREVLGDLADRCRSFASERRRELLAGVTVAVPDTLPLEGVRACFEHALSVRGLDFVEVETCPAGEIALQGVRFRPRPDHPPLRSNFSIR